MAKIAVVLCGCGRGDGSEIQEAVSCLVHLSRLGAQFRCFAPDAAQADVINHLTGEASQEKRNQLVEAARIARGEISPLAQLRPDEFDAVVFPGGFGAAKNLCTFAKDGEKCTVMPDVERIVKGFHRAGKPVSMCCIAPVIGARVLGKAAGGPGISVTIGDDKGVAAAMEKWGSKNVVRPVTEAAVDEANRITSAPAYMYGDASPWEVYQGIGRMIEELMKMIASKPAVNREMQAASQAP
jgi:enhancing lycopene biosynthesis protein 2